MNDTRLLTCAIASPFALVASVAGLDGAAWAAISTGRGDCTYLAQPLPLATLDEGHGYLVRFWGPRAILGVCEGDVRGDRLGGRGIATEGRRLRSRRRSHGKTQLAESLRGSKRGPSRGGAEDVVGGSGDGRRR